MSEPRRIRDLLRSVYSGPAWHGPSISENLEGIDAAHAAAHPVPGAHSIWEITLHLIAWEREVARVLAGKPYATMRGEDDWPPVKDTSEEAWQKTVAGLREAHSTLAGAIADFSEDDLEKIVPGRDFPWHVLLHGAVHHSLYHSGQIAILKKTATAT